MDPGWYGNSLLPSTCLMGSKRSESKLIVAAGDELLHCSVFGGLAWFSCGHDGTSDNAKQQGSYAVASAVLSACRHESKNAFKGLETGSSTCFSIVFEAHSSFPSLLFISFISI